MNKLSLILLTFFLLIFSAFFVNAAGTCSLDKSIYAPSETALFACSCTLVGEENILANIVWKKADGTVLKTTPTSSGSCVTNFFTDSYTFGASDNFIGNVTFDSIAASWTGAADIRSDNFNVSGLNGANCIILDIDLIQNQTLGKTLSVNAEVKKAANQSHSLGGVACHMEVYNSLGLPILIEPHPENPSMAFTSAGGEITLQHTMDTRDWDPFKTYLVELNCFCPLGDVRCYNLVTGVDENVKSCSATVSFTTGADQRKVVPDLIAFGVIIGSILLIAVLLYFSTVINEDHVTLKFVLISSAALLFMVFGKFMYTSTLFTPYENSGFLIWKFTTWFVRIFVTYVFIYFIYDFFMRIVVEDLLKKGGRGGSS